VVWVHPRIHPLSAVPTGITRSLDGRIDRVPHGSITFDSLREYVVGDELRRVHWRTSARIGELMVREHLDTSQPRIVVLLDNRSTAHPLVVDGVAESFEAACEAAASVVAAAIREDLPVTLLLVANADEDHSLGAKGDNGSDSGTGSRDVGPVGGGTNDKASGGYHLDRLAAAELRPGSDALPGAATRLRGQRLGDTLVFLTGPGAGHDLGHVGALRSAYPSLVVGMLGSDGPPPPGFDGMLVISAADGAGFAAEWDGVRRW
jgi:hypothetical protein